MSKITITRGDNRTINVPYLSSTGEALDLTGATVFFTANATDSPDDDTAAAISKTVTSISDPTAGVAVITLTNSDTDITPGEYFYDIQVKDSLGNVTSSKKSKLVIVGDITRRTT